MLFSKKLEYKMKKKIKMHNVKHNTIKNIKIHNMRLIK
jgi:hypothetical protein